MTPPPAARAPPLRGLREGEGGRLQRDPAGRCHRRHWLRRTASGCRPGASRLEDPPAHPPLVAAALARRCRGRPRAGRRRGRSSASPPGRRRRHGHPCRRSHQGASVLRLPGGQSRRHTARFVLLSSLAAREPLLSPYGASKRAAEEVVAGRSGPWLAVRAPAVYGPGDRETLAYFRAVARGVAPRPNLPDARLSVIHVADLADALALAVEQPAPASVCEIDDGREGGYGYNDMQA